MEDIKTVHYATKDPIRNLKIRVHLTRLSVQRIPEGGVAKHVAELHQQQQAAAAAAANFPPGSNPVLPPPSVLQQPQGPLAGAAPAPATSAPGADPPTTTTADPFAAAQQQQQPAAPRYQAPSPRLGSALPMFDPALGPPAGGGRPLGEAMEPTRHGQQPAPPPRPGPQQQQQPQQFPPPGGPPPLPQGAAAPQGFAPAPFPAPPQLPASPPQPPAMVQPFQSPPNQASPPQQPHPQQQLQHMLIQGPQGPMLASAPAPPPGVRLAPVLAPPGAPPPPAITNPPLPPAPPAAGAAPIITWGAQGPIGPPAGAPLGTAVLPIPPHLQQQQWAPHVDPTTGQILGPPVTVPPTAPGAGPFPVPPPAAQFFPVAGPQGQQPPPPPPQGGAAVPPPQRLDVVRDFVWQEKVHSVTEVAAARRLAELHEAAGGAPAGDGGDPRLLGLSGRARRYRPLGSHVDGQQPGNKKTSALDPKVPGSVLFTYVHSDDFAEREELNKTVTTSAHEQQLSRLYRKVTTSAKLRQEVLNFRTMYIMADLAEEHEPPHSHEVVLVCVKAFADGSFDMRPGFSRPGKKYRFEDDRGGIYEFTVEDASAKAEPSLTKRTAKLQKQVAARAVELRAMAVNNLYFQPAPPDPRHMRLAIFGEIMGCADFARDHLYVEYLLFFDPTKWEMVSTDWAASEPGVYRGVTATTRVRLYPADPATNTPERWVGHFAHPFECELVSRGPEVPPPVHFPLLILQVCSMDHLNRYSCMGYGWHSVADACPGSCVQYVRCWRPLHRLRDLHHEYFIGGSNELRDPQYVERGPLRELMATRNSLVAEPPPGGVGPKALTKYGFKTETTGTVKVRLHCLTQQRPDPAAVAAAAAAEAVAQEQAAPGGEGGKRNKRETTLAAVVERARSRLREARGGDVMVRPGLVSELPVIRAHPADARASDGHDAQFRIVASGMEPLRYQWFKNDRKLEVATADSPQLILVEVTARDAGAYYCQVSNKDGSVNSAKATLVVDRVPRAARAAGGTHVTDEGRSVAGLSMRGSGAAGGGGAGRLVPLRMSRLQQAAGGSSAQRSPLGSVAGDPAPSISRPTTPTKDSAAASPAPPAPPPSGAAVPRSPSPTQQPALAPAPAAAAPPTGPPPAAGSAPVSTLGEKPGKTEPPTPPSQAGPRAAGAAASAAASAAATPDAKAPTAPASAAAGGAPAPEAKAAPTAPAPASASGAAIPEVKAQALPAPTPAAAGGAAGAPSSKASDTAAQPDQPPAAPKAGAASSLPSLVAPRQAPDTSATKDTGGGAPTKPAAGAAGASAQRP